MGLCPTEFVRWRTSRRWVWKMCLFGIFYCSKGWLPKGFIFQWKKKGGNNVESIVWPFVSMVHLQSVSTDKLCIYQNARNEWWQLPSTPTPLRRPPAAPPAPDPPTPAPSTTTGRFRTAPCSIPPTTAATQSPNSLPPFCPTPSYHHHVSYFILWKNPPPQRLTVWIVMTQTFLLFWQFLTSIHADKISTECLREVHCALFQPNECNSDVILECQLVGQNQL